MWGRREDIEEAKLDLYKLGQFALQSTKLENSHSEPHREPKFDKIRAAPTEIQAERIAKYQSLKAKTQHFKRPPEDPSAFSVMVSILTMLKP